MANDPIQRIGGLRTGAADIDPRRPQPARSSTPAAPASFRDVLAESVGEVQRLRTEADTTVKKLVAGEIKDVTDAMIAVEKADLAFQTMMAVRGKMVAAYEEIMRMQV